MNALRRFLARFREQRGTLSLALLVFLFCTAPTPGDVGGCLGLLFLRSLAQGYIFPTKDPRLA